MFNIQSHIKADSVTEAIALLTENPDSRLIAGGTDVLIKLRHGNKDFTNLIDINGLEELRHITMDEEENIIIGSGAVFTDLIESEIIQTHIPELKDAALSVGGPQIRNVATIGGNLCNGVTSADSAPGLFSLNAQLIIQGTAGTRKTAMPDFFLGPGKIDLKPGEVLTAIKIPANEYQAYAGYYYKYAMRDAMDIATIGCGVSLKIENRAVNDFRITFGVAGPVPLRCPEAESKVVGMDISHHLLETLADTVVNDVNPRTSWRATKEFRINIIKELSRRATIEALKRAGEELS